MNKVVSVFCKKKRADGRYQAYAYISPKGKRHWVYDDDRQICKIKLGELEDRLKKGILSCTSTFGDYADNWLEAEGLSLTASTLRAYKSIYKTHIKNSDLANKKIVDINHSDIQSFLTNIQKANASSEKTLKNILGFIKTIFTSLKTNNYIDYDPTGTKFKIEKTEPYQYYIYNVDEMRILLELLGETKDAIPVSLAALCGLRISEVMGLRWEDVDFENHRITIRRACVGMGAKVDIKTPKTKTSFRTLILPAFVEHLLYIYKKDAGYIYGIDADTPENATNYSKRFTRFLKNNGLPHTRFHDLRHFNATTMMIAGVPEKQISDQLGHADSAITKRYQHILKSIEDRPAKLFDSIVQPIQSQKNTRICSQNSSQKTVGHKKNAQ